MKHRLIDQIVNRAVAKTLPEAPFKEVTDLPARHAVSGVPVVDRDDKVLGGVSETDLMYRQAGQDDALRPGTYRPGAPRAPAPYVPSQAPERPVT
ncbi:CBS domain-containing protein [Streptomyces chrestomyceticus]|uniref:CBS domain-containing protein n=1 Tax=Streptomyces chrestomyceticus TaxID=68185 RepID=UPI001F49A789|nr:CBS domain-containing protein [Streptomyces chrestomyceticus]